MSVTNRVMGLGLKTLNRFAGLSAVDKLGLRKPAEQVLYRATQTGFRTASAAGPGFSAPPENCSSQRA